MRRNNTITRTLLILFIVNQTVNFVFGAPGAVREKRKGRVDAGVTGDGTAALQKRVYPTEEGSTNMAGQTPPSPDRTEVDRLWQEMREQGMLIATPTPLHIPGWSTPPFSEGSSTGSNPTPTPPLENHIPSAWPWTADTLSTSGHHSTPQQSSGPVLDVHPPPNPELHPPAVAEMPIDEFLDMLMTGRNELPKLRPPTKSEPRPPPNLMQPSPNLEPRPLPNPLQPPPNPEPHPPVAAKIDKYLDMPMKGRPNLRLPLNPEPRPLSSLMPPPPNPESRPLSNLMPPPSKPELHPLPNRVQPPYPPAAAEMPTDEFLDMLMTGRTKRPKLRPPTNPEPRPLPNPLQPPPNPESHPPAAAKIDKYLNMPMKGRPNLQLPLNPEPRPPSNLMPPPPDPEPRPLSNLMPPPSNQELHSLPNRVQPLYPPAAAEMPTDEFLDMLMTGRTKRPKLRPPPNPKPRPPLNPMQPSLDLKPRPLPNLLQPPPNPEPHPPTAAKIDKYLDMPMKGRPNLRLPLNPEPRPPSTLMPPPPNRKPRPLSNLITPPSNPELHPLPNPVQLPHPPAAVEMPINEFLDMLMKGGTKRPKL